MRKLLSDCVELYLDLISDSSFPIELTEDLYGLIMDIKKKLDSCYYVCKTGYVIKYDPGQPRGENGRWIDSGGSSGGSSSRRKLERGKYPTSNNEIDKILENELSGVKFSAHPVYNGRIASAGKTVGTIKPSGKITIKSMEIGKQYRNTKEALIDTIIHEELEARIMLRSRNSKKFSILNRTTDAERHKYINRVIKKYFSKKGWDYGLV